MANNEKIFIRENQDWIFESQLESYAESINNCIPAIKALGIFNEDDYKALIRYCCKGGRERLKNAFLSDLPENSTFRKVASCEFDRILSQFPQYTECANKWKWVKLLKMKNGLVVPDYEAVKDYNTIYLTDPVAIDKYNHLQKLCAELTFLLKDCDDKVVYLHRLFCFDSEKNEYVPNHEYLSDRFFLEMGYNPIREEFNNKKEQSNWENFEKRNKEKEGKNLEHMLKDFDVSL